MNTYQKGKSGNYAEIIIDFEKKKVDLINPQDKSGEFKKNRFSPEINALGLSMDTILLIILIYLFKITIFSPFWTLVGILLINYLMGVIFYPKYNNWLDKWNQKIFTSYLSFKKAVIVENIDGETWKLPYDFKNNLLNYELYGDYKRLITKIHIKPKDYYIKKLGKLVKQIDDWEAFFYFSENPKIGKMIIEFN
jgi:hypothetical protein